MSGAAAAPRELGSWTCTALVVGNTIGIGVFVLPRELAPFGFAAVWGWLLVAAGCIVLARGLGLLARSFPAADGPYDYVRATLGEIAAFVAMWCYWVSLWITNATIAVGAAGYLLPLLPAGTASIAVELAFVWVAVGANLAGVRTGGRVQVVATVLKLVPIAAVIGVGAWLLLAPGDTGRGTVATPSGLPAVLGAASIALFAMLGIESATVPAGRVRDPARTLPRATLGGTLATAAIYVAVSLVPLLVLGQAALAVDGAPFVSVLDEALAPGSGSWVAVFVAISGLGAMNGWTLLAGQLTRTLADAGALPARLARPNRCGAPAAALVLAGALATAMVLASHTAVTAGGFQFLAALVTAANLPLYLCCSAALVVLAARARTPARGAAGTLGGLGLAFVALAFAGMGREPLLLALALAASGVPLLVRMRVRQVGAGR